MTVPHDDNTKWRKATRSQNEGGCVELHPSGAVRDSKDPGPRLDLDFAALIAAVQEDRITP